MASQFLYEVAQTAPKHIDIFNTFSDIVRSISAIYVGIVVRPNYPHLLALDQDACSQ